MKKSFSFILNPIEVIGEERIELIPDHWLERADEEQADLIREKIAEFCGGMPFKPEYEREWIPDFVRPNGEKGEYRDLDKWRYWIISIPEISLDSLTINLAVELLKNDLDLGFTQSYDENYEVTGISGFHWNTSRISSFFDPQNFHEIHPAKQIKDSEIKEITKNHALIKSAEKSYPILNKALQNFSQLKSLPRQSQLVTLGYFSIIEAIVTHKPRLNESLDSLNHQVSTKMVLLSKKFQRLLDYDSHFGQLEKDKVWKLLYGYRSALAHGIHADFKSEFKSLKDISNVLSFLKESVKLTLLLAMKDPEFITDLKKC
jgi:hypothetical protein